MNGITTLPVSQSTLTRWAAACHRAYEAAAEARALLAAGDTVRADALMEEAREAAEDAHLSLLSTGAQAVEGAGSQSEVPLHLLNTPATRRLLSALRYAVECAEGVDEERGNVLPPDFPLQPGESRGTGWAETISNLTERLRVEVEGPRGRE